MFKSAMDELDQHRKASSEGLDNMGMARRLIKRAEAIRKEIQGMDSMEGTWTTFTVKATLFQKCVSTMRMY